MTGAGDGNRPNASSSSFPTIPDVLEWKYAANNLDPTQEPVSVLTPLVESSSNPGAALLDPFCGSGSTLLAAKS
jgi:adenine-specific DNA-methyltransferase